VRGTIRLPRLATPALPSLTSIAAAREHIVASLHDRLEALGYEPVGRVELPDITAPSIGTRWDTSVNTKTGEALSIHCCVKRWRIVRLSVHYEIVKDT
jgi:hypothetical protein